MEKPSLKHIATREETSIAHLQRDALKTRSSFVDGYSGPIDVRDELSQNTGRLIEVNDPVQFNSQVRTLQLIESPVETFKTGNATPSVLNITRGKFINTSAFTVTNFLGGQEGQELIVIGDGFTTLQNNANIVTGSGSDLLLQNGASYRFLFESGKWRGTAAGASYSAGAGISIASNTISNLYVGKHVDVVSGITLSIGSSEPTNLWFYGTVADLTGMTQYRISFSGYGSFYTTLYPFLAYSTNDGNTWTNVDAYSTNFTIDTSSTFYRRAWGTLPAAARVANCFVTVRLVAASTVNVTFYNLSLEFKP